MELLKKLTYKNLKLNKKRTIVTIVGILLAVALLTALSTLVSSFRVSLVESEKKYDGNFHYVYYGATSDDVEDIKNNRNIESVYTLSQVGYAKLTGCKNEYKPYAYVCGTDEDGMKNLSFIIKEGRYPENDSEIIIPSHLKTNGRIDYKIGDTITLAVGERKSDDYDLTQNNPFIKLDDEKKTEEKETHNSDAGKEDSIAIEETDTEKLVDTTEKTYKVVGIMGRPCNKVEPFSAPGYTFLTYMDKPEKDITVYTRYTKKALKNRDEVTAEILGVDKDLFKKVMRSEDNIAENDLSRYMDEISNARYNFDENHYLITYESFSIDDSSVKVLYTISIVVAIIIIVTSVYCIKNSFDISITEKIRQYGMLASVGATRKQIRGSVLYEGFLLGVVGIPLGVILGIGASFVLIIICNFVLEDMLNLELIFSTSPLAILVAIVLGIVTIYLSSIGSAIKAARVSPIAAIRSQGDIKIKSKKIRAPKIIRKIWGIGGVVSYKNLKRNKKKYRTTVVSIFICTVTFIVISYFMSMGFDLVKITLGQADYSLSLKIKDEIMPRDLKDSILKQDDIDEKVHYYTSKALFKNLKKSEQYKDYLEEMSITGGDDAIQIIAMEDDEFKDYARKAGVSYKDCDEKVILINETTVFTRNKETDKMVQAVIPILDYEKGDVLGSDEGKYSFEIAGVTNERMMGYVNDENKCAYFVMSKSTWDKYNFKSKNINHSFYFTSDDTNELQDCIEDLLKNNNILDEEYTMYNIDEDKKQMNSLFMVMAIFAYGLIGVIALIGITNIINTINTSMQLRSREFATLRSIGMTQVEFNKMIRLESFFTGMKSLIFGVPVGLLLSYYIYNIEVTSSAIIPFRFPIKSVIICTVVVFGLLYGIMNIALKKINSKNIIETIKDENI